VATGIDRGGAGDGYDGAGASCAHAAIVSVAPMDSATIAILM
jgi:hypothetical protein